MNTTQITTCMTKISPYLNAYVCASNRLPLFTSKPVYIISNLDPDYKPGSHWIAIHITNEGYGEYFDSYGRKPTGHHLLFLKRNSKMWIYNSKEIQNDFSSVCGEYCLMYIYFKYKGKQMYDFLEKFSDMTLCNDVIVKKMFELIFLN